MAVLVQIIHDLLDAGRVINAQITGVSANRSEIEKGYGDHSASEFVHQLKADFRSHDGYAANLVFHHALGGLSSSPRIVIGVAENGVVAQLPGACLEALDDFREKRIFDIGDDNAQRAAVVRREMARVHVANVAQLFDRGQNQAPRLGSDFSGVIQDVRHGCGGDRSGFRNITNRYAHDGKYGQLHTAASASR